VATFPSYYLNRTWTWAKRGKSHLRKEIIPFWTMSLFGIGFSNGSWPSWPGSTWCRPTTGHHIINTLIVVVVNLASFAIFLGAQVEGLQPDLPRERAGRD
jgi:putative flippase GtrA